MKNIYVYYQNILIGTLYVDIARGKEVYSFEYSDDAFIYGLANALLDKEIFWQRGRQFKTESSKPYHFMLDSMPDRWGRNLIKKNNNGKTLMESDYLLQVSDISRMGALQFKEDLNGPFLNNNSDIPPLKFINELEDAAYNFDEFEDDEKWKILLSPGSSMGGARPKATLYGANQELYLAKFSHKNDTYDAPLIEYLTYQLAKKVGLEVEESKIIKVKDNRNVFITKRFDRKGNQRIPYVSFMTILSAEEGDSNSYSYLDVCESINEISGNPKDDLEKLYKLVCFNIIVHNYDNHLRNLGMIYIDGKYQLSPCFDLNISLYPGTFALSVDETNENTLENLAKNCSFFHLNNEKAMQIADEMQEKIKRIFVDVTKDIGLDNKIIKSLTKALFNQ